MHAVAHGTALALLPEPLVGVSGRCEAIEQEAHQKQGCTRDAIAQGLPGQAGGVGCQPI